MTTRIVRRTRRLRTVDRITPRATTVMILLPRKRNPTRKLSLKTEEKYPSTKCFAWNESAATRNDSRPSDYKARPEAESWDLANHPKRKRRKHLRHTRRVLDGLLSHVVPRERLPTTPPLSLRCEKCSRARHKSNETPTNQPQNPKKPRTPRNAWTKYCTRNSDAYGRKRPTPCARPNATTGRPPRRSNSGPIILKKTSAKKCVNKNDRKIKARKKKRC